MPSLHIVGSLTHQCYDVWDFCARKCASPLFFSCLEGNMFTKCIVGVPHVPFQHRCKPASCQAARGLSRSTSKQCLHRASFCSSISAWAHGPRTLALKASQSFVYRELTKRVIIVFVIVMTVSVTFCDRGCSWASSGAWTFDSGATPMAVTSVGSPDVGEASILG